MPNMASGNPLDPTIDPTPPTNASAASLDAPGYALYERVGVGGMGEVFRCGDDALGRDLAIKVIKAELHGDAHAEERFLREAKLTGALQHPGIVPIHQLGRLADGRPYYTMKLIRGRTFADMLRDEPSGSERLPHLLAVVEKMAQAVAYAHNKGVIHRDLKPNNVMVGEFGEVQVMDWGLAKELSRLAVQVKDRSRAGELAPIEAAAEQAVAEAAETVARGEEESGLSRAGAALGTPAYMPPEQAAGDWDIVDERADVFALGAILCEVLTGRPPYFGGHREELLRRVHQGDVAEALQRVRECGADAALVQLVRECLAANREGRPRNAGEVAERLSAYESAVQERLRQAELERVAAEARAGLEQERTREALARIQAERRARQRLLALAGTVLILLAGGGAAAWWMQQVRAAAQARQSQADGAALEILEQADLRLEQGWQQHDLTLLTEAKAEAIRAVDIARSGQASASVQQRVADFQTKAEERLARAKKNRALLNALLDVATPRETSTYRAAESPGMVLALAEPTVEEQYVAAFRRRWPEIDLDTQAAAEVAARLQEEPAAVVQGVIAGLDGWMSERRQKGDEAAWRRLLAVVERLDASQPRRQLRALLLGAPPSPRAEDVAALLAGRPPWPALWQWEHGTAWRHLLHLRGRMKASDEAVLTVLLLARISGEMGDLAGAETVLRQALARRPDEVALLNELAKLLERQEPARKAEAIGCYRAARARRPELGVALLRSLSEAGQAAEGEEIARDLLRHQPHNPELFFCLSYALLKQGKPAEGEKACRQAIALRPDYGQAYSNLGAALYRQGKPREAEAAVRKALALQADYPLAHCNLGALLFLRGKIPEAEAAFRKAIALYPNFASFHSSLGAVLLKQGKRDEAEAACRKAIELKPDYTDAYYNLSLILNEQGKPVEAEAASRATLALKPDYAQAYTTLGSALHDQGKLTEAEAAHRKAIALEPKYAVAYTNLGTVLIDRRRYTEAEEAFRKAIAFQPDYATAHYNLGNLLNRQGKRAQAEACFRKAIAHQPNFAQAHTNLGNLLNGQGRYEEAEAACRKAIAHQPKLATAHVILGNALNYQGRAAEAEASYRQGLALRPDYAEAHCNLGVALRRLGRFAESLAEFRRGHEVGSKQPGWRYPSLQWVRAAERFVDLENKLPAILRGEASAASTADVLTLAEMCQRHKNRYAASARFYADAFRADPKLAADLNPRHRYNAACSAALAAAGRGQDAHFLPDKVATMFRGWALGWLRDDLTVYVHLAERNDPRANQFIQRQLAYWRRDPDFASLRDPHALARLSEPERAAWHALWREVDELVKRTAQQVGPATGNRVLMLLKGSELFFLRFPFLASYPSSPVDNRRSRIKRDTEEKGMRLSGIALSGCLLTVLLMPRAAPAAAPAPLCLEQLACLNWGDLEQLYHQATPGTIPTGYLRGRAIYCPGAPLSPARSKLSRSVWHGKHFYPDEGTLINQWCLGMQAVRARVGYGESWLDGRPSIVMDYRGMSHVWSDVRDEIREVAPGLYLGLMYRCKAGEPRRKLFFVLEACSCPP